MKCPGHASPHGQCLTQQPQACRDSTPYPGRRPGAPLRFQALHQLLDLGLPRLLVLRKVAPTPADGELAIPKVLTLGRVQPAQSKHELEGLSNKMFRKAPELAASARLQWAGQTGGQPGLLQPAAASDGGTPMA